jgi:dynein heavy chain
MVSNKDVQGLSKKIVEASILVYKDITTALLPTPAKSHYTFNLRDISKVFQGILMTKPRSVNTEESFVRLWIHEVCRVFHDRLINTEDRLWFTEYIADKASSVFRLTSDHNSLFVEKEIMFGDFMKVGVPFEDREYEEIIRYDRFTDVVTEYMDYSQKVDLVLFRDA